MTGTQLAANSPHCDVELRLGNMGPKQTATCTGWGCHFAPNQASFVCDQTVCTCPNGCKAGGQDYEQTFKGVSGKTTFDCQEDGTSCALVVSGTWVQLNRRHEGPVLDGKVAGLLDCCVEHITFASTRQCTVHLLKILARCDVDGPLLQ